MVQHKEAIWETSKVGSLFRIKGCTDLTHCSISNTCNIKCMSYSDFPPDCGLDFLIIQIR